MEKKSKISAAVKKDAPVNTRPGKVSAQSSAKSRVSSSGKNRNSEVAAAEEKNSPDLVGGIKDSMLATYFTEELKDLYWAEKQLVSTLAKMAKETTTEQLRQAFIEHREETIDHVSRLEEIFEMIGEKPVAKKCDAMDGITRELNGVIEDTIAATYTRDVALIMSGQKAEHYEIAAYGGMVQLAMVLGYDEAAELLLQTLDEEKAADSTLSSIAENSVNEEALNEK